MPAWLSKLRSTGMSVRNVFTAFGLSVSAGRGAGGNSATKKQQLPPAGPRWLLNRRAMTNRIRVAPEPARTLELAIVPAAGAEDRGNQLHSRVVIRGL